MRRSRDSITDLGDGRQRIRITAGYDPKTGKQLRPSRTIRGSRRAAEAEAERMHREYGTADAHVYGRLSVYAFIVEEYLPLRTLAETTRRGYDATLRNHVEPHFSRVKLKDANAHVINKALAQIEHPGAQLNVWKMLAAAFAYATDAGIISTDPMARVPRPELPEYEADVYTLEEALAAIQAVRGLEIEPGVLIAATIGSRASETCALDWTDLVLEKRMEKGEAVYSGHVPIDDAYHQLPGMRITRLPKTKKSDRENALPGFVVKRLLELRGDGRLGPLMMDRTGQRMTPGGLSSRWRRLTTERRDKQGRVIYSPPVRHIELKNLRHSRATILLALGASLRDVQLGLGHSRESTTATFYDKTKKTPDYGNAKRLEDAAQRVLKCPKQASGDGA